MEGVVTTASAGAAGAASPVEQAGIAAEPAGPAGVNAYPAGPDRSQWQACVNHNNSLISALNSSAPTVGTGTMPTPPAPPKSPGQAPTNNCPPGLIGCAGVAQ